MENEIVLKSSLRSLHIDYESFKERSQGAEEQILKSERGGGGVVG